MKYSSFRPNRIHKLVTATVGLAMAVGVCSMAPSSFAADHGDAPYASVKRSADLNDLYLFLDPNDNSRVVTVLTLAGFTVPGEGVNFSVFDSELVFDFLFETTGDAEPDRTYQVSFSRKVGSGSTPQTARIKFPNGRQFRAPTTTSTLDATSSQPVVSEDPRTGLRFFAGSADDPFFFDIPGFNRFVSGVLNGDATAARALDRGRDTFAGYNTLAIALSVPVARFGKLTGNTLGASARVYNTREANSNRAQIDRIGVPGVNVALVPFTKKDAYNRGSTAADAAGKFGSEIVGTLTALGTNQAGIDTLASLAVTKGDFLRVNVGVANQGPGGGSNTEAAFPNGRRLQDDVIDTIINVVTNGGITTGDNVDRNDVQRRDQFPFLGATHQPRATGVDDLTRN